MGTKNNPSKFDCYAKADPDEPMFILLARDPSAVSLVWLWCVLRELNGDTDGEKIEEARQCLSDMIVWGNLNNKPAGGLAQSVLAGVLELTRAANYNATEAMKKNEPTSIELVRTILCTLKVAQDEKDIPKTS